MKAIQKERHSQRTLANITMTYLKNSGALGSLAAARTRRAFMTVLAARQRGATSTRTEIKSKRRARGKLALDSSLPKQAGRPTPQARPRDGDDR